MSMSLPQSRASDVRRRTVLPTTLQNLAHTTSSSTQPELLSEEYLDKMEEELNRKVDVDTEVLVEGMAELVKHAQVSFSFAVSTFWVGAWEPGRNENTPARRGGGPATIFPHVPSWLRTTRG